jgi:DNA-binding MarR family transcriptional regulator
LGSESLWSMLGEMGKELLAFEGALQRKLGLSEAEYKGIRSIEEGEKITCQEFSQRMELSVSRGSRVVDRLCHKKLVRRVDCPSDRRCKNVWLTEKGALVRQKIEREIEKREAALNGAFSEKKLAQLKRELEKIAGLL